MTKENAIQLFEDKKVRSVRDSEAGKWYISIVDMVEVCKELTDERDCLRSNVGHLRNHESLCHSYIGWQEFFCSEQMADRYSNVFSLPSTDPFDAALRNQLAAFSRFRSTQIPVSYI